MAKGKKGYKPPKPKPKALALAAMLLPLTALAEGPSWTAAVGPSLLDGRQQLAGAVDVREGSIRGHVGGFWDSEVGYLGASYMWDLGEVSLGVGGVLVSEDTQRISEGPNFHLGVYAPLGPFEVSLRHISNGAQTFGHDNYPNTGENMLLLGWRF